MLSQLAITGQTGFCAHEQRQLGGAQNFIARLLVRLVDGIEKPDMLAQEVLSG